MHRTPFEKPRLEGLCDILRRYGNGGGYGVEVGVQCGKFSERLLDSGLFRKLFLVDMWEDHIDYDEKFHDHAKNYMDCIRTMARFSPDLYSIVREESTKASRLFQDGSLDFVYLDANHSYAGVRADLHAWYPKVRKGGILCGDDYHVHDEVSYAPGIVFGVTKAVDEFSVAVGRNVSIDLAADWFIQDAHGDPYPARNWWFIV